MNSERILTPWHPRWAEFTARLQLVARCRKTTEHAHAALVAMDNLDVAASLRALAELGGECDCTILFDLCVESQGVGA